MFDPALKDQILGVCRVVVPALLMAAAGFKWISSEEATSWSALLVDAIAAIVTLVFAVWSAARNRQASQIAKVARLQNVKQVVVDDRQLADVDLKDEPKVVPASS